MWLIVGASGYLGSYFLKNILEHTDDRIVATYCSTPPADDAGGRVSWRPLDLAKREQITALGAELAGVTEPLRVIVLSAIHHPDKVRENFAQAAEINFIGLTALLGALPAGARLWYVSSDVVYGESVEKHFFRETDPVGPVNAYGRQKVVAEQIVLAFGHNVARCSFLIGPSRIGRPHFYDVIASTLRRGDVMEMLADQYRSAIDFDQASELILRLMQRFPHDRLGVVNIGSDQPLSKFEVAQAIARAHDLPESGLKPVLFGDSTFFADRRARDILLDNSKLKRLLGLDRVVCRF
ncbi:NAD-dependent epimerase/dehydratase family protein [Azospirillum rugosum]|uniref:Nucleoside-diphosphate-sugar epimerase n=1 Tax=Azospirillum rugosum TaxID=416170 RepID=A0ABS4SP35_9PROT|nr:sugar nucleotide-binding protein [Azospirillum rugosum]MBP2294252.1 nucleoside-diphosphate-sugar epimerase [Azospirillum rugosum]MDQ0527587.1 nucleoside-diphosphate-sugar epimerase [Azospirillum rugosum]